MKIVGLVLVAIGLFAVVAEVMGYSLLIYYGDPVGGFLGIALAFLGILLITIPTALRELRGKKSNPLEGYVTFVDTYNENVGYGVGWFATLLVVVVFVNVLLRYVYGQSFLTLQDGSWYIFGLIFMIGAAYTLKHDRHVRVDIFFVNYPPKVQVWVNMLGTIFFLIPFCILALYVSWGFVGQSFNLQETSPDAGGLAARYLAKAVTPIGFILLLLQGVSLIFTCILQLTGQRPLPEHQN
ncbi:MAG: TRAP transporter small permease subunit [Anaerolineae bacterium]|nr:TRAP transporter small permease subunit [Anaerolineae bacterium]